jgi:hypothetical protein
MKVDQQAERYIEQLHVGKKLGFMNSMAAPTTLPGQAWALL